jgi:HEPN domain-containing protein
MKVSDLVRRVDELIVSGKQVQATRYREGDDYIYNHYVSDGSMTGFRSACLSFIERVFGKDHSHYEQFTTKTSNHFYDDSERAIAILEAIRGELQGGWLFQVKSLVASELFSDILEQAEHLLEQGYKDAAAVMIGSVLEEHLRQLCIRNNIDTHDVKEQKEIPRKADRLNSELAKAGAYTAIDAKQITAWLGLRNSAAHGEYSAYSREQVQNLASGVLNFIARVPC